MEQLTWVQAFEWKVVLVEALGYLDKKTLLPAALNDPYVLQIQAPPLVNHGIFIPSCIHILFLSTYKPS